METSIAKQTIFKNACAEITEKKSRFIASASFASTSGEAIDFIAKTKKKYWDARHNCFAYVIGADLQTVHSSDDGEPQGTAGRPLLSVITRRNLYNIVIVVTRYFGGTLLGTAGLIRAYSSAAEKCLNSADIRKMVYSAKIKIEASYGDVGKLQNLFAKNNIKVISSDYTDKVIFKVLIPSEDEDDFLKRVNEITSGKSLFETEAHDLFET